MMCTYSSAASSYAKSPWSLISSFLEYNLFYFAPVTNRTLTLRRRLIYILGPNCWLKEHKLIIPAGRQVWVDKCHVCYCPTSKDKINNLSSKIKNNNVDVSLDAFVKQSSTTMSRKQPPLGLVDTQHAVCVYEKSYACDEEA